MNSLRERFYEFHTPNTFSLATKEHKLTLYIGLDAEGNKALKFRGKFTYEKILGTALISVKQFKSPQYNTLLFSLLDNSSEEVFFRFSFQYGEFVLYYRCENEERRWTRNNHESG